MSDKVVDAIAKREAAKKAPPKPKKAKRVVQEPEKTE